MQKMKTLHRPKLGIEPKKEGLDLIGHRIDENNVLVKDKVPETEK
jgi:hypothetical protein